MSGSCKPVKTGYGHNHFSQSGDLQAPPAGHAKSMLHSESFEVDAGFALKLVVATVLQICSHKSTLCSICCFWQSVLAMMSCRFGGLLTSHQFVYVTELFKNCVALLKAKLPNVKGVFGIIRKVPRILSRGVRSS